MTNDTRARAAAALKLLVELDVYPPDGVPIIERHLDAYVAQAVKERDEQWMERCNKQARIRIAEHKEQAEEITELRAREADTFERVKQLEQKEVPRLRQAVREQAEEITRLTALIKAKDQAIKREQMECVYLAEDNAQLRQWRDQAFADVDAGSLVPATVRIIAAVGAEYERLLQLVINRASCDIAGDFEATLDQLIYSERQAAVAAERERCAEVVDERAEDARHDAAEQYEAEKYAFAKALSEQAWAFERLAAIIRAPGPTP